MKTEHAEDAGPLDDAALVTAAQHDRAAFGALYERYVDLIYRDIYRQAGNHIDAEDVTTRTFQQARATLPDFEPGGASFGAWLRAIAHDLMGQSGQATDQDAPRDERIIDLPDSAASDLLAALRRLPLEQQRAIVLKFARGQSSREIGGALNQSEDVARQLIHRALIALRAALESE